MRPATLSMAWGLTLAAAASLPAADFAKDIQPVFESSCLKCHGSAIQLSKFDLRTRESAMKGGSKGVDIIAGKAEESRLYRLVAGPGKTAMPIDRKLTGEHGSAIIELIHHGDD